jgi:hypothetical protein
MACGPLDRASREPLEIESLKASPAVDRASQWCLRLGLVAALRRFISLTSSAPSISRPRPLLVGLPPLRFCWKNTSFEQTTAEDPRYPTGSFVVCTEPVSRMGADEKGKPSVRKGRKATGLFESAGPPNRS